MAAAAAAAAGEPDEEPDPPFPAAPPRIVKLPPLAYVSQVLSESGRVKFTCIAASNSHLVVGATTGGVYCFDLASGKLVTIIQHKEGHVVAVAVSPDGNTLAVGTAGGAVVAWEHNLGIPKVKAKRLKSSTDLHKGSAITALRWHADGSRVYSGDDAGRVCCVQLDRKVGPSGRSGSLSLKQKITKKNAGLVHNAENPIVQLACAGDSLLVSSTHRVVAIATDTNAVTPVGTKARDGQYGTCFGVNDVGDRVIFSARPGSRVWVADATEGTVMNTVNCKTLFDVPSTVFLGAGDRPDPVPSKGPQSMALGQLHPVAGPFLLASAPGVLALINPNPSTPALLEWHADVPQIASLCVVGTQLYALEADGINVLACSILQPSDCSECLISLGCVEQAAQVLVDYSKWASVDEFCDAVPKQTLLATIDAAKSSEAPGAHDLMAALEKALECMAERYDYLEEKVSRRELREQLLMQQIPEDTSGIVTVNDGTSKSSSQRTSPKNTPSGGSPTLSRWSPKRLSDVLSNVLGSSEDVKPTAVGGEAPETPMQAATLRTTSDPPERVVAAAAAAAAVAAPANPSAGLVDAFDSVPTTPSDAPSVVDDIFAPDVPAVVSSALFEETPAKKKKKKKKAKQRKQSIVIEPDLTGGDKVTDVSLDSINAASDSTSHEAEGAPAVAAPTVAPTALTVLDAPPDVSVEGGTSPGLATPPTSVVDDEGQAAGAVPPLPPLLTNFAVDIGAPPLLSPDDAGTAGGDDGNLTISHSKKRGGSKRKGKKRATRSANVVDIADTVKLEDHVDQVGSGVEDFGPTAESAAPSGTATPVGSGVSVSMGDAAAAISALVEPADMDALLQSFYASCITVDEKIAVLSSTAVQDGALGEILTSFLSTISPEVVTGLQVARAMAAVTVAGAAAGVANQVDSYILPDLLMLCLESETYGDCSDIGTFIEMYLPCFNMKVLSEFCAEHEVLTGLEYIWSYQTSKTAEATDLTKLVLGTERRVRGGADESAVFEPLRNDCPLGAIRALLPTLVEFNYDRALQLCASKFPQLRPWYFRASVGLSGERLQRAMLHYYDCLLEPRGGMRASEMVAARNDPAIVSDWVEALLQDEAPSPRDLFRTNAGGALTEHAAGGSNALLLWKRHASVMRVLKPSEGFAFDPDDLVAVFRKRGFWPGVIALFDSKRDTADLTPADRRSFVETCVHVGDIVALERAAGCGVAEWRYALDMIRVEPTAWAPLTVADVVSRMAVMVGTADTFRAVEHCELMGAAGSTTALRLLKAHTLEGEQAAAAREVLESVDSFLWSKRSDDVPLPLQLVIDAEAQANSPSFKPPSTALDLEASSCLLAAPMQHWGCQTRVAVDDLCPECHQPLVGAVEQLQVYRCGRVSCNTCRPTADACACSRCHHPERFVSARRFTSSTA
mmetsp:Transcript_23328/g.69910  ORF Transcript_23328/g.69910 Transcript_23328/m.69910 type:complete len:1413 (-) Transcript_23328:45-4283(-)